MNRAKLAAILCFLTCFLLVTAIQHWSGATTAAFDGYPDEPAHFLGGLMVRDYLTAGCPMPPHQYAINYYLHLPYFAIGYWPPLFYLAEGLWMTAFGYSRAEVLLFLAFIGALIAASIFVAVRSPLPGFLGALLFILLPDVLTSNSMVMTDTAVALLSIWSVFALSRFFETGSYYSSILFGILASCTIMTKYNGGFLALLPPLGILLARRWDLLRRPAFWLQPAIVAVLCGPWLLYTKQFTNSGFSSFVKRGFVPALLGYVHLWVVDFGLVLSLLLFGAWIYQTVHLPKAPPLQLLLWLMPVAVLVFQAAAPVDVETRYLIPALAPLILLLAFNLMRLPYWVAPAVLALAVLGDSIVWLPKSVRRPNHLTTVVESIVERNRGTAQSLVYVPADSEGPMIAEFAIRDPQRPVRILARTNKLLAKMDWLGNSYQSSYQETSDLQKYFLQNAPDLVILHPRLGEYPHEQLLETTIHEYSSCWKLLERTTGYDIYEFVGPSVNRGTITAAFRSRMIQRFEGQ